MHGKIFWTFVAAIACVSCTAESGDDTGGDTTSGSATQSDSGDSSSASSTNPVTDGTSSEDGGDSTGSTSAEESTGHAESTGHDSTGHVDDSTSGSESSSTGQTVCDILGEGCHDNKTPEGIDCHLVGHDGDEAACEEIFDMCAKICGL